MLDQLDGARIEGLVDAQMNISIVANVHLDEIVHTIHQLGTIVDRLEDFERCTQPFLRMRLHLHKDKMIADKNEDTRKLENNLILITTYTSNELMHLVVGLIHIADTAAHHLEAIGLGETEKPKNETMVQMESSN